MPPPLSTHQAASTFETFLQKCTSITSSHAARQLHGFLTTSIPTSSQTPFLYNNILSMYARCGSLSHSHKVFDRMPQRTLVTFNALIAAYSRAPPHSAPYAFELLGQMQNECHRPNGATLTSLLQASASMGDGFVGSGLHTQVVKFGFSKNTPVETCLLGMYSECGDLDSAHKVFDGIETRDDVAWNSMILGSIRNDRSRESLHFYQSMVRAGLAPTQFTYSLVLNACSRLGDHAFGRLVHAQVIVSDILADLPMKNALLDMYRNCGDAQTAFVVFSTIGDPDIVSWNSMIAGCSGDKDEQKAMHLFKQLRGRSLMRPDEYTFAAIISAVKDFPASSYGKALHAQVEREGYQGCVFVGSTLVSMYFRNGEPDSAEKVFGSISQKDAVLWTEMIAGYSRMEDGEYAIKVFNQMCQEGYKTDGFILSAALSACAHFSTLRQGEMIHCQALKTGNEAEVSVCSSLIDMYAKNGSLQGAESVFFAASELDLKCWNSMLGGYSHHGRIEEALELFDEIQLQGLLPDGVTFLSVLAACNHCGLVEKGKFLWNCMKENGLVLGPKHYCCMVSLLSRAGLFKEAEELIIESPFREDYLDLWRTLLSSCIGKRNLKMGLNAAELALRLDAEDCATHILVSNLYAAEGRWDDAAEIRRKIRNLMLEKDPGLSWVEILNDIHVFSSGDQLHPRFDEATAELGRLLGNMVRRKSGVMEDTLTYDAG